MSMSAARRAIARALKETLRDAGAGAAGAGATTAAQGRDAGEIARNAGAGALVGATAGRALRKAVTRTGNAGPVSSVRKKGRGLLPAGESAKKRVARRAAREAEGDMDRARDFRRTASGVDENRKRDGIFRSGREQMAELDRAARVQEKRAAKKRGVADYMRFRKERGPLKGAELDKAIAEAREELGEWMKASPKDLRDSAALARIRNKRREELNGLLRMKKARSARTGNAEPLSAVKG